MKKFLCGIMCAAFLVSNQAISFAQDVETKIQSENSVEQTELTKEMIENKIQELQSEFGLTYEFLDDTTRNSNSIDLHFDTLEEYEAFIREISQTRVFKVESAEKSDSPNLTRSEIDYLRLEKDEVWLDTIARGYIPRVDVQYLFKLFIGIVVLIVL